MSYIEVNSLTHFYKAKESPVLKDVSFQLNQGEILGIIGPNGGGKSTLLKILAGLINAKSGSIKVKSENRCANFYKKLGYIPQKKTINTILPIQVDEFLKLNKEYNSEQDLDKTLESVGMIEHKNDLLSNLSGGELQRVLIANALSQDPELILFDEPTTGLDGQGQDQLITLIKKINQQNNTTIIMVDHNINQVLKNCDKLLCLNNTHHWHDKKELFNNDILTSIYHCELEHLMIHDKVDSNPQDHKFCDHNHDHNHKEDK